MSQSYQWTPMTDLKFANGPKSHGFSPGLLWRTVNVLLGPKVCAVEVSSPSGYVTEGKPIPFWLLGGLAMYKASCQTLL